MPESVSCVSAVQKVPAAHAEDAARWACLGGGFKAGSMRALFFFLSLPCFTAAGGFWVPSLWLNNPRHHIAPMSCKRGGCLFVDFFPEQTGFFLRTCQWTPPCIPSRVSEPFHKAQGWDRALPGVRGGNDFPMVLGFLHEACCVHANWVPLGNSEGGWQVGTNNHVPTSQKVNPKTSLILLRLASILQRHYGTIAEQRQWSTWPLPLCLHLPSEHRQLGNKTPLLEFHMETTWAWDCTCRGRQWLREDSRMTNGNNPSLCLLLVHWDLHCVYTCTYIKLQSKPIPVFRI